MAIERIEIECVNAQYLANVEVVLRGQGARRKSFREPTRERVWHEIETWLREMNGETQRGKLSLNKPAA